MIRNNIYASFIPIIIIVLAGSLNSYNYAPEFEGTSPELNIDQTLMNSLINEMGDKISVCSEPINKGLTESVITCPCGGQCNADPGNVCTLCSEWQTQYKFVPCPPDPPDL